jgi:hypothetical protein
MADIVLPERGVQITVRGVDEPGAEVARRFGTQQAHIEDALRRLPESHLPFVPPIEIGNIPRSGGAYVPDAGDPPQPVIRLSRHVFAATYNARYLFTLIHEIGHAVDRQLHAVYRFQRRTNREGADADAAREWEAFRAIEYRGRNLRADGTPEYGEHFAEGYAHCLTRPGAITREQQRIIREMAEL